MTIALHRLSPAVRLLAAVAFGLIALAMLLHPANGQAHGAHQKARFGADLSDASMITPVSAPQLCPLPGSCTRVQNYYDGPPHAGNVPFAPFDGTIKTVKLLASSPGKLKLQLVEKGQMTDAKVTRNGPTIKYQGTGQVETFKVSVPVENGEWVGIKAKEANTLSCDPTTSGEGYLYQPALTPGGPFSPAYTTETCTALIGATVVAN